MQQPDHSPSVYVFSLFLCIGAHAGFNRERVLYETLILGVLPQ
jgi:hypothetical protein